MEGPEEVKYSSPAEAIEQGEAPQHRFDLIIEGEQVGGAEVDYLSKPIPLYQVTELYVDFEHKGKGYASMMMEKLEKFLVDKRKPGVLVDGIIEGDPASGMYDKRGWKKVSGTGLHVFNWPDDVPTDVLIGYPFRYTDYKDRKGGGGLF